MTFGFSRAGNALFDDRTRPRRLCSMNQTTLSDFPDFLNLGSFAAGIVRRRILERCSQFANSDWAVESPGRPESGGCDRKGLGSCLIEPKSFACAKFEGATSSIFARLVVSQLEKLVGRMKKN